MWFHVDGAFGAWVKISKTHRRLAVGMERADSLAIDLHKWMYMPYGIGCPLMRHPREHLITFVYGHEAKHMKTMLEKYEEQLVTYNLGVRLSNGFLALKVYMLLRAYGIEKYSRLIQQDIDQTSYIAQKTRSEPDMEVTAPVASNMVCFRYKPKGLDEEQTEKLNRLILQGLCDISAGVISDTPIKGKYMPRACCVNHRSRYEGFNWSVAETKKNVVRS